MRVLYVNAPPKKCGACVSIDWQEETRQNRRAAAIQVDISAVNERDKETYFKWNWWDGPAGADRESDPGHDIAQPLSPASIRYHLNILLQVNNLCSAYLIEIPVKFATPAKLPPIICFIS